jgi:regulator of sigma E protease
MVEVTVAPQPARGFGLVMEMGKVASVQDNSPAAGKIKSGDFIASLADAETSAGADDAERAIAIDPMTLPETLRRMAEEGRDVEVTLSPASQGSGGRQDAQKLVIPLRKVTWLEGNMLGDTDSPVVATALGVAYRVLNVVDRVEPDSPAAAAGLAAGDVITSAKFVHPAGLSDDDKDLLSDKPINFGDDEKTDHADWPAFVTLLQAQPAGTKVEFSYERDGKKDTATLEPVASTTQFVADRGWGFEWVQRIRIADNWSDAVSRGWHETSNALLMVYRFLGKLGSQVSVKLLGGPVTIAQAAGFSAAEGPGKLLVFLTMLSANLAVINFLPIPMLDGGHMAFLLWEGIRGKPAGERFAFAMHAAGFAFIITLMLFVLGLDFHRLFTT